MKKINGVTMDGSTVIDIDCNLDEIVIPEYAVWNQMFNNKQYFTFVKIHRIAEKTNIE